MNRLKVYNSINYCGNMSYEDLMFMLENVKFKDISDRLLLQTNVTTNGKFRRSDWLMFINSATYMKNSSVTKEIASGWLECSNKLNKQELISLLENLEFEGNNPPTILISSGVILTASKKR